VARRRYTNRQRGVTKIFARTANDFLGRFRFFAHHSIFFTANHGKSMMLRKDIPMQFSGVSRQKHLKNIVSSIVVVLALVVVFPAIDM
jgi:hypothetical protein